MKHYAFLLIIIVLLFVAGTYAGWYGNRITLPYIPAHMPSLTHEADFSGELEQATIDAIKDAISIDQTLLKTDPKNLDGWLDLAIQYKQAGDSNEAIKIWKYLDDAFPSQHTSAFNLGTVYHQNLKDYGRSETSYREAIRRAPTDPLGYLGLHELYRYAYKQDTTRSLDILLEGMRQVPTDVNMPIALAAYYRDDKKEYSKSIEYIQKAIDVLQSTGGDTKKIQALRGEIERLNR